MHDVFRTKHYLLILSAPQTNSGCGKREARNNWSMAIPEKAAPVTGTALRTTGPMPADSQQ